jgi:glyoxylase-like metal-dependent hydrolase (beta-lactamase superfamily II)
MTIQVHQLTLGLLRTNCYIIGDSDTHDAIVIDPAAESEAIFKVIRDEGYTVREILATHTHFDHVLAVRDLKMETQAPFRIHKLDLEQLSFVPAATQRWFNQEIEPVPAPDAFVDEGDSVTVGAIKLDVLFTPGHSLGHVSYVCDSAAVVFCGDTLFKGTIGRTDIPGSDPEVLRETIMYKLMPLFDDYTVACGHGHTSTIGQERQSNPFVLEWYGR